MHLTSAMNETKWNELRLAMLSISPRPNWSTTSTEGYQSKPDGEWFHHFREGGYGDISFVDIFINNPKHEAEVLAALKLIHVPGERTESGFRIYGYLPPSMCVDFL